MCSSPPSTQRRPGDGAPSYSQYLMSSARQNMPEPQSRLELHAAPRPPLFIHTITPSPRSLHQPPLPQSRLLWHESPWTPLGTRRKSRQTESRSRRRRRRSRWRRRRVQQYGTGEAVSGDVSRGEAGRTDLWRDGGRQREADGVLHIARSNCGLELRPVLLRLSQHARQNTRHVFITRSSHRHHRPVLLPHRLRDKEVEVTVTRSSPANDETPLGGDARVARAPGHQL